MTSNSEKSNGPVEVASDSRRAGLLFVFGGLLFLLLTTVSEAVYPNFSLQTNAISDLAAVGTSSTIIEGIALLGLGASWTLAAYYLFRNGGRRRTTILSLLPGVGYLLAGLSPENVNIIIHSSGAPLAFVVGSIVAVLSYRKIQSLFRYFALALGSLSIASTFVIFVGGQLVGPCGTCAGPVYAQRLEALGLGLGGWESMIIYPLMAWLIGYGSYLLGQSGQAERRKN